jgi:hypothetical protein
MTSCHSSQETVMAARKKSAKRTSAKKKKPARKAASKTGSRKSAKATASKPRSRKASKTARGGLNTMRQVGEKTWETLKSTTAQVVEGVKETFGS